jgi:hypothetical protein
MEDRKANFDDFFSNGIEKCNEYEDYLTFMIGVLNVELMTAHKLHELYWKMNPVERMQMDQWFDFFTQEYGIRI